MRQDGRERETERDIYIHSIFVPPLGTPGGIPASNSRFSGNFQSSGRSAMSAIRASSRSPRIDDESDDLPPPYSYRPTDDITLEVGPNRPFQPPPQQPRNLQLQQPQDRPPSFREQELSDFARDFYTARDRPSRSSESLPSHSPPRHPQSQNSIPNDGRPTRTPVPGHPLLNNGKTLVYPAGYECDKCMSALSLRTSC